MNAYTLSIYLNLVRVRGSLKKKKKDKALHIVGNKPLEQNQDILYYLQFCNLFSHNKYSSRVTNHSYRASRLHGGMCKIRV